MVMLVKAGSYVIESYRYVSGHQDTVTDVLLRTKRFNIKIAKNDIVPLPPRSPTEQSMNFQNESSAEKEDIPVTVTSNISCKRKQKRIHSRGANNHFLTNICFYIAIALCFQMLPVTNALQEMKTDIPYSISTSCCYTWELSEDHTVNVNGQAVGMCNAYCHKHEEEEHNKNIILKKDGTANILIIKERSCAFVHVTICLTGDVTEKTVPQSGDSCQKKPRNAGKSSDNNTHVWIWSVIIAFISDNI